MATLSPTNLYRESGAGFIGTGGIAGIERINITGLGNNSAKLALPDVLHLSDVIDAAFTAATSSHALVIDGNAGDSVDLVDYDGAGALPLSSWQLQASDVGLDGSAGGAYDLYQITVSGVKVAMVAVDADMAVV